MSVATLIIHEGKSFDVGIGPVKKIVIEEHLGSGGFADVWKIKDIASSKHYVLKHIRIKRGTKNKSKLIQRIKNEASIKIPSKYIVPCIGLKELKEENFVLIFEYIHGCDLDDWIRNNKDLPWKIKKNLFIEILRGVNDAHRMNVIHRDLKPDNIFITPDNKPKIIDFGLAKFKDKSITVTGELGGALPYMDPHALLKGIKYVDSRCDVYALGTILYELVMGMHYWLANGIEFEDFVRGVVKGKHNILEMDKFYDFPEDPAVEDVIRQSTMFDSEKRTRNVNDMITQLGGEPSGHPDITVDFSISSPVLIVEDGSSKGSMNLIVISDGHERQLGRMNLDATNNTISKRHAKIYRKGNKYFLYDTNSTNGTYLNGSKIDNRRENAVEIRHTDRIRFGDLWTRFVFLKK